MSEQAAGNEALIVAALGAMIAYDGVTRIVAVEVQPAHTAMTDMGSAGWVPRRREPCRSSVYLLEDRIQTECRAPCGSRHARRRCRDGHDPQR
jgi:hypothetical protein